MSDQPLCVCGHEKRAHFEYGLDGRAMVRCMTCDITDEGSEYHQYQPALPWPDSEGIWETDIAKDRMLRIVWSNGRLVWMAGDDRHFTRDHFEARFGPARFTKLLAENPFKKAGAK